jgi:hypothetical protein
MKRRGAASKQTTGMTTMTNIQTNQTLSDAELDAVVGGGMILPKAMQALDIYRVEHSVIPKALQALFIRRILMSVPAVPY